MIPQAIQTIGSALSLGNNVVNQGLNALNAGLTATNCLVNTVGQTVEQTVNQQHQEYNQEYTDIDMSDVQDSPLKHLIYLERKEKASKQYYLKDGAVHIKYKKVEIKTDCVDLTNFDKAIQDDNSIELLVLQASMVNQLTAITLALGQEPIVIFKCNGASNQIKLKAITALLSIM